MFFFSYLVGLFYSANKIILVVLKLTRSVGQSKRKSNKK